jgi:hypothetical protein
VPKNHAEASRVGFRDRRYCRLHPDPNLAADLRLEWCEATGHGLQGEKQMLRTQPESVAASSLHVGIRLVGGWTLDLKPPVKRNVVPTGSGAESLELSPIDPAGRQTLILVWTLQSYFVVETSVCLMSASGSFSAQRRLR